MKFNYRFRNIHFGAWLNKVIVPDTKFTHLAPVKNADPEGIYRTALDYAMTDENIRNIALTGPYGSGKSSIIRTYEQQRSYRFLNISLACFKEEKTQPNPEALNTQHMLIERSILQQMLYGIDAEKLTYSRFKKITTPKHEIPKAFAILLWLLSVAFIAYNKSSFLDLTFFEKYFSFGVCVVAISLSLPVLAIIEIIRTSYKVTFSKLSLTNAEIEIKEKDENSILNRHLDEIIYFFQVTRYDAVVIEDLDRFGSPEIFVKLREINKLVNENSKIKWPIRFIYALKDDMFVNEDRAKFFEYIIPVIPVINSSNSEEKFLIKLNEIPGSGSIEKQFIKDVSYYVDDLRLIYNILNEFMVYSSQISSSNIDKTKQLAMLLYKNVYPGDFEKLHNKEGVFFGICAMKRELIDEKRSELTAQIKEIRERLIASEHEEQFAVMDLIRLFIGYISSQPYTNIGGIICNGNETNLKDIKSWDDFKSLFGVTDIIVVWLKYDQYYNRYNRQTQSLTKSFKQIENEISPHASFLKRKENIENKAKANRQEMQQKLHNIELERNNLTKRSLCQLLRDNDKSVENIANDRGLVNPELFSYLVEHGYLNEEYHIYISNFHEVRMTRRDREFIISVLSGKKIEHGYTLDTPEEVCSDMREDAFSSKYALNVTLIDFLLENKETNNSRLKAVFSYIAENLNDLEDFFFSYWTAGKKVPEFTNLLSAECPNYGIIATGTTLAPGHIALILSHIPSKTISKAMNRAGELSEYVSTNGFSIFSSPNFSLNNLKTLHDLSVKFHNLEELSSFGEIVDYAHSKDLYRITKENILFLMKKHSVTGATNFFETANYTSLERVEFATLKKYVNENLAEYIKSVFLTLPQNTKETGDVIKFILNNETLDLNMKKAIVSKQEFVFPDFKDLPLELWTTLIDEEKIEICWANVSQYFGYKEVDKELLSQKVFSEKWLNILSGTKFETERPEKEHQLALARFFLGNDEADNHLYARLTRQIPYIWSGFHNVSVPKMKILVEEKKVSLCKSTFDTAADKGALLSSLIEINSTTYFKSKDQYPIDDNIREHLLRSSLTTDQKIEICHDVTSAGVSSSKNLANVMAEILAPEGVDCTKIKIESMKALIANVQSIENSIRLLNKCIPNWSESDTMSAIAALPLPFSDIAVYGKRPKLDKNELNSRFAGLLKSSDFISNWKEEENSIRINTYKSEDHSEGNNS